MNSKKELKEVANYCTNLAKIHKGYIRDEQHDRRYNYGYAQAMEEVAEELKRLA